MTSASATAQIMLCREIPLPVFSMRSPSLGDEVSAEAAPKSEHSVDRVMRDKDDRPAFSLPAIRPTLANGACSLADAAPTSTVAG